MNALAQIAVLPDVQSRPDYRALSIEAAGIRDLRYPVIVQSSRQSQATIATFSMSVGLAAATKGTHMSRFVELLDSQTQHQLNREPGVHSNVDEANNFESIHNHSALARLARSPDARS
jgi:GTP cyclohydrolase FolE2